MKKKVIMAGAAVIMSAVAVGFSANTNNNMTDLMSANLEALTNSETNGNVDCYASFDTPQWFVNDYYQVVCVEPETGKKCVQIKGHNFTNHSRCDLF